MNRKLNVWLSLAAGMLGGMLSHYVVLDSVHAQAQAAPPKEITAKSFVLVNDQGATAGTFGFDQNGNAMIRIFDKSGKVIWSAGKPNLAPLSSEAH
jgi:hypothetical protein